MGTDLLLKFREKDTGFAVTRDTLRELSEKLGISETMTIHLSLARMAGEVLSTYEADEGPLSPEYLQSLREFAKSVGPKGKVISKKSLF